MKPFSTPLVDRMTVSVAHDYLSWWADHHRDFRALLLDIDGTLSAGDHPLPGAMDLLAWLRSNQFAFSLLTNDGNRSPAEKCALLAAAGIEVSPSEIISCGMGLELLSQDPEFADGLYFEAGELGTPSYAASSGLRTTKDPGELERCHGIILGEGTYDWQLILNAAFNALLRNPRMHLIVPNPDSYWPNGAHGEIGIGAGGKARFLVQLLADAGVSLKPLFLGKPYGPIFDRALAGLSKRFEMRALKPAQVLMIGDSLKSDIRGANRAGLASALVLSGITPRKQAMAASGEERPQWIFEYLGH